MRLLYVVPPAAGGIRSHLTELVTCFSKEHEVMVISPPDERLQESVIGGGGIFLTLKNSLGQLGALRKLILRFNPSLLHLHGYKAELLGRMAVAGFNIPIIVTLHNYLVYPGSRLFPASLFYRLERFVPGRVHRYIAVSEALKADYLSRSGTGSKRVTVIYNGIRLEAFSDAKPRVGLKGLGTPLIGTALRLTRQKGIDVLLDAAPAIFQRYPNASILISGEGPLEKELKRKVARMGLKKCILFLGFVENLAEYLASLDIFVLPSRTEGLGIILLEALACGVPVLATGVGGIPEIITSGTHGLLVPPRDQEQLAAGIETLWENKKLMNDLVENGKERIKERFLLHDMLIKTRQVYDDVMRERDRV